METKDWYKLTFLIESDSEEIIIWKLNELGIFSFSFEYLIKNENKKEVNVWLPKDEWGKSKLHHFFAKELPRDLAKCVAQRKSVTVTDFRDSGIFGYINKETTWEFAPIIYSISDYETQSTNHQSSRCRLKG